MSERRAKYHAVPERIDGYYFPSQAEARRYLVLKARFGACEIKSLQVHPRFEIIAAAVIDGKHERAIYYEADFQYREDGNIVVEDVKGYRTPVYRIKRRLFLQQYAGVVFREVEA